jgi:hypothetical protein
MAMAVVLITALVVRVATSYSNLLREALVSQSNQSRGSLPPSSLARRLHSATPPFFEAIGQAQVALRLFTVTPSCPEFEGGRAGERPGIRRSLGANESRNSRRQSLGVNESRILRGLWRLQLGDERPDHVRLQWRTWKRSYRKVVRQALLGTPCSWYQRTGTRAQALAPTANVSLIARCPTPLLPPRRSLTPPATWKRRLLPSPPKKRRRQDESVDDTEHRMRMRTPARIARSSHL